MLEFLKRMFKKNVAVDPDAVPEEFWTSDLSGAGSGRFSPVSEDRYHGRYLNGGGFELALLRKNLFAWAEEPGYRYEDFALEAEIEFTEDCGHCAAGFLLRAEGDRDFLYVLVSNRGFLRVDAVFNGSPHAVIPWTECPAPIESSINLKIVLSGTRLTVAVDDLWAAECEDETVRRGTIAFAAQNYDEAGQARCVLRYVLVESRPVEVEAWRLKWSVRAPVDPAQRVRMARSLAASGLDLPALVQLRKVEKSRPLDGDEFFLRAECSLHLGVYEDAEAAVKAALAAFPDPRSESAVLARDELANILYLRGRYLELRDELEAQSERVALSARLSDLLGHAQWNLGEWEKAAEAYGRAANLNSDMPIFSLNEARAWDQAGKRKQAADAYETAARGFFAQESFDDLDECLRRLKSLRPRSSQTAALEGKMLYRDGKTAEAEKVFRRLVEKGVDDSAVYYLLGLIVTNRAAGRGRAGGDREEALRLFRRACELESTYPLYWFRLAEALFLSGDAQGAQAPLARARELSPDEGWGMNLAGLMADREGDAAGAERFFQAAATALPGEKDPVVNLADLLGRSGRAEEALKLLAAFPDDASARNQAGNILARESRLEEAAREYAKAVHTAQGTVPPAEEAEYRTNAAACYLELDQYSDAEEQLRRALELGAGKRTYILTGDLAARYGDRYRAETAWLAGLELYPGDADLLERLARHRLFRGAYQEASETTDELEKTDPERAGRVRSAVLEATTVPYVCAKCGRSWRAPKELTGQSSRTIRAQPPDDTPAGSCPHCGKVFCVGCRKDDLKDSRFTCPDCGEFLKLTDDRLRYLVLESLSRSG